MTQPHVISDRAATVLGGLVLLVIVVVVGVAMMASNNEGKAHLNEYCKTEGAAPYRGGADNERVEKYITSCK
jgi:hypothetical protein